MSVEFTSLPQFDPNNTPTLITEEMIGSICRFFSTSFAASSYEPGKIDIVSDIFKEVLNISNLSPGHITPTHFVRHINSINFYEFTDIFYIAYYYHIVTILRQIDVDSEMFLLKPPSLIDDNYETNLACVLTKGFFLNYFTYHSNSHFINDHSIELHYSDFFYNMWSISKLSTDYVLNISEMIDKGTTFPSKLIDNAHYIENIIKNSNFYQNTQEIDKLLNLGINPFSLPFLLFKVPDEVDDLTKLLFIGWHYGYPTYSDQLRILDNVLILPQQCKNILSKLYEVLQSERYHFQLS